MSLSAGKLRHRVSLESVTNTQDPTTGEVTQAWQSVGEVSALIEPLSAREFVQSATNQAQVVARITIRYRTGVTAAMRVVHRGKVYNIAGVLPDKESGREYLTLPVTEGVNEG
jgi:SPP1 family predicted phage head-tail adaptor